MVEVLVTGGAGFIGSNFVRYALGAHPDWHVTTLDKLTYAGRRENLHDVMDNARHTFVHGDIADADVSGPLVEKSQIVVHFAAETHVDRSIDGPAAFVETNVQGTCNLLEAARTYLGELKGSAREAFRFLHVSTDEVYGDLAPEEPAFNEERSYAPSSPYSATKAAADHLVRAWHRTYGLPVLVTHSANNYGPYQLPDKLIPLMIGTALAGKPLPVYGDGRNIREWLHVDDHARALRRVLAAGRPGRTYAIGGEARSNLDVVHAICAILDRLVPRAAGTHRELVQFVADRPGHDRRYATDDTRIRSELGWSPSEHFDAGLEKTVRWYVDHHEWIRHAREDGSRGAGTPRWSSGQ